MSQELKLNVYELLSSYIGMLSKSLGQTLRVIAAMHVLFDLDSAESPSCTITEAAIEATIDFVELCCQHTAYITGRGKIDEEVTLMEAGKK